MLTPKQIADSFEKEFGFMCINALIKGASLMFHLGEAQVADDLKDVYDVLVARGWKPIQSKEEYELNCQIYGKPEAFKNTNTEKVS